MTTSTIPSRSSSPERRLRSAIGSCFQQITETAQRAYPQAEWTQAAAQPMHADFDRSVRGRVAAARQSLGNRLLADDAPDACRECFQQRQLACRQVDTVATERYARLTGNHHQ